MLDLCATTGRAARQSASRSQPAISVRCERARRGGFVMASVSPEKTRWLPALAGRSKIVSSGFSRKIAWPPPCTLICMHAYPKRLDAFDYLGPHRYFLTFCTYERQPLFHIAAHVALIGSHFCNRQRTMGFADLAHCFMPDHLHTAVEGRHENADLKAFVARMKQVHCVLLQEGVRRGSCGSAYRLRSMSFVTTNQRGHHLLHPREPNQSRARAGGSRLSLHRVERSTRSSNWLNIVALPAKAGSYHRKSVFRLEAGSYIIHSADRRVLDAQLIQIALELRRVVVSIPHLRPVFRHRLLVEPDQPACLPAG